MIRKRNPACSASDSSRPDEYIGSAKIRYIEVECPRLGFVRGENHQRFVRTLVELHLRGPGAQSADVAGEGVFQQVLARAVQPLSFGHIGGGPEGVPGELMHRGMILAPRVGHEDGDVVSGMVHESVDEQSPTLPAHAVAHDGQHIRAGNGMAADGANVGLDDAHRDPHASASSALGVHRSTSGRPHRPLLGSLPYAAFARSLPIALHPQLTIPCTPSWNRWFLRGGFYPMAAGLSRPPS